MRQTPEMKFRDRLQQACEVADEMDDTELEELMGELRKHFIIPAFFTRSSFQKFAKRPMNDENWGNALALLNGFGENEATDFVVEMAVKECLPK